MKTYDELAKRWDACQGGQILVDHLHPLKMYLNVNEKGNKELLIPVEKMITAFQATEAIGIKNYKYGSRYIFAIELLSEKLEKEFICLCFDLIESSRHYSNHKESLASFFDSFKKWYSLWVSVRKNILPVNEIRGLMGEIKHMLDEIDSGTSEELIINSWTIHKDASRDFIYDRTWDEIKTIQSSGDYITISSLEQLEHDSNGRLIVYRLDRIEKANDETYTLNSIVKELRDKLGLQMESELSKKLLAKGYSFNDGYDTYVFKFAEKDIYIVNDTFPRISRNTIPNAIYEAQYEILLNQIEAWRRQ